MHLHCTKALFEFKVLNFKYDEQAIPLGCFFNVNSERNSLAFSEHVLEYVYWTTMKSFIIKFFTPCIILDLQLENEINGKPFYL